MKKLNKSFLAIAITLGLTGVSYVSADLEVSDGTSYVKMTNDGQMTVSSNSEYLKLKGKIDGYKVVLNWSPYVGEDELLGYRVEFEGPDGTESTLSVGADKASLENWDAKAGENKYQVFAVGSEGDLKKSNEIVLKMGSNGGYDFSNKSFSGTREQIKENRQEMVENMKDFREGSGYLVQYLSGYTEEQIKQILDTKKEYQDKLFEIIKSSSGALTDEQKAQVTAIRGEYLVKIKELVGDNQDILKFLQLRTDIFNQNQQLRDENKDLRQEIRQDMGTGMITNFQGFNKVVDKRMELRQKYKKLFVKSLEIKLENISVERLKTISLKIDALIEKYNTSDIDQTKKDKMIAQLEAIKEIINDKLTTSEDLIDIDELLKE